MRYVLVILLMLVSFSAEAQKRKKHARKLTEPPMINPNPAQNKFTYNRKYTAEQFWRKFPLNKTDHVLLISYAPDMESLQDPGIVDDSNPQPVPEPTKKIKVGTDTLGYKEVHEIIVLERKQIDSLMSLMYSVSLLSGIVTAEGCYFPRNSILFLDQNNEKVAFLDMCFECHNLKASHKELDADEALKGKYELMLSFFREAGIKFGTVKNEDGIIPRRE